jgi:hypothetical protein
MKIRLFKPQKQRNPKILRDLSKHTKIVKIENPLPQDFIDGNYYELDEALARGKARLIAHYGEEMRLLIASDEKIL